MAWHMLFRGAMPVGARTRWVALAFAFGATIVLARDAFAQACTVSTDCPKGFVCTPTNTEPNGGPTCTSGQCQSDSDCAAGFRCLPFGSTCTADADGGQDCQPDNLCAPQWEVPCTANSQCGPGFTCALDGGALPNPATTVANAGVIDCGPDRFDASIPSYATAAWISCEDIALPPGAFLCDGGNADAEPPCLALCEAGTLCLSITTYSCSSPAVYESCQSEADCPATWTCACPFTCTSGGIVTPDDAGPVADAGCAPVCIPPNADLSPFYGQCGGGSFSGSVTPPSSTALDAGSGANPTSGGGVQPTASVRGGCQTTRGSASSDGAPLLLLAVVLAAAHARTRRAQTRP